MRNILGTIRFLRLLRLIVVDSVVEVVDDELVVIVVEVVDEVLDVDVVVEVVILVLIKVLVVGRSVVVVVWIGIDADEAVFCVTTIETTATTVTTVATVVTADKVAI